MIILDYDPKKHKQIIHACTLALKGGKTVVYPTDTSYGLACDVTNAAALRRLYKIKGRSFNQPVHIVVPSLAFAAKAGEWSGPAKKLAKAFWPGPLSLVLPLKAKDRYLKKLGSNTGTVGLRYPKHKLANDLARSLGRPITATSANRLGQPDSYSLADIMENFAGAKHKPDIIINAGRLPKRKPSTLVKVQAEEIKILRPGPITQKQIFKTALS